MIAGWSSLVARRAHNPKVAGSNPAPAIKKSWEIPKQNTENYLKIQACYLTVLRSSTLKPQKTVNFRSYFPVTDANEQKYPGTRQMSGIDLEKSANRLDNEE